MAELKMLPQRCTGHKNQSLSATSSSLHFVALGVFFALAIVPLITSHQNPNREGRERGRKTYGNGDPSDSWEGDPPCVLLCFEQTLVASQRQILAEWGIRLLVLRSAQKNHDRLGILISNINMSSWYLLTEKDFSPRQQNLVFPQVSGIGKLFLVSFNYEGKVTSKGSYGSGRHIVIIAT
ncbi:hypothetical protein AAG906_001168 [Vitis piasezkii]